jgi:hypothetical protein
MRDIVKLALYAFIALVLVLVLGLGLGWFGMITGRPMAKYQEETRTQVYDQSRSYQQGANRDIARYCQQMRTEPGTSGKKAIAALIRSTMSTYDGPLSPDNQDCVSEAKGI